MKHCHDSPTLDELTASQALLLDNVLEDINNPDFNAQLAETVQIVAAQQLQGCIFFINAIHNAHIRTPTNCVGRSCVRNYSKSGETVMVSPLLLCVAVSC